MSTRLLNSSAAGQELTDGMRQNFQLVQAQLLLLALIALGLLLLFSARAFALVALSYSIAFLLSAFGALALFHLAYAGWHDGAQRDEAVVDLFASPSLDLRVIGTTLHVAWQLLLLGCCCGCRGSSKSIGGRWSGRR